MKINLSELAKLILLYVLFIIGVIMLFSCNPVKQVLADIEKVKVVRAVTDPLFPCANDSLVFIHDSTTVTETVFERDTLIEQRNDTTFVNYFDTAIVTKTVTKNTQTVVVDKREVNKHIDTINAIRLREAAFKGQLLSKEGEIKKAKSGKNLWFIVSIFSVAILLIIGVLAVHKALTNILPIRK